MKAIKKVGPIAEAFSLVNAGTMLEKIRGGKERFMATWEAPLVATWGKRSFLAKQYPANMVMKLWVDDSVCIGVIAVGDSSHFDQRNYARVDEEPRRGHVERGIQGARLQPVSLA